MSQRIHYFVDSQPNAQSTTLYQATGTALTGSYAQAGSEILIEEATTVFLHLYWTKGDETSIEIQARFALRSGGTAAKETVGTTTNTDGTTTVKAAEYSFSTATDNIIIPIRTQGRYLSVFVKATGGTTGTFGLGLCVMRE